jgi:O-succinylbenzoic acid--CoA ligase
MADIRLVRLPVVDPASLLDDLVAHWERSEAVLPLDPGLPRADRERLERGADMVPEGTALVIATSGTAGPPKRVILSHRAVATAVRMSNDAVGAVPGDRWLCCIPATHVGGLLTLLRSHALGSTPVVQARFDASAVAAERRARFVSLVPTMLQRLLEAGAELRQFDRILVGGGRLDPSLKARAAEHGACVTTTYGMTETCGGVVYDGIPLPGVEVDIRHGGRVALRSPTLMTGYLEDRDRTASSLTDGWLLTQDTGHLDAHGRLHVTGRLDRLIVTGGNNVDPDEVATALEGHPGVERATVRGEVDAEWGQKIIALVVPTDPGRPPGLKELHAFLEGRIARYKLPREVRYVERLVKH